MKACLPERRCNVWNCILAEHMMSNLLKHATWYHIKRSAAQEQARGRLPCHPVEGKEWDLEVLALSLVDDLDYMLHVHTHTKNIVRGNKFQSCMFRAQHAP